jgi:hypothetical protein
LWEDIDENFIHPHLQPVFTTLPALTHLAGRFEYQWLDSPHGDKAKRLERHVYKVLRKLSQMCPSLEVMQNFLPWIKMNFKKLRHNLGRFLKLKAITIPGCSVGCKAKEYLCNLSAHCKLLEVDIIQDTFFRGKQS